MTLRLTKNYELIRHIRRHKNHLENCKIAVRVAVAKTSPSRHGAQDQDPREASASNIRTLGFNNDFLNETL